MPDWIAENAFVPFATGILGTGVLGCAAYMLGSRTVGFVAAIIGLLSIALVVTERYIVTDREQVKALLYEVANDVEFNRHDAILTHMKVDSPAHKSAKLEMPKYQFRRCSVSGIRSLEMNEEANPASATLNFVVFVDVNATRTHGHDGMGRREVTLHFEKQPDGTWQIVNYSHRHPTGDATL